MTSNPAWSILDAMPTRSSATARLIGGLVLLLVSIAAMGLRSLTEVMSTPAFAPPDTSCSGFAQAVVIPTEFDPSEPHNVSESLCAPDGAWAMVSPEYNPELVLDMGHLTDGPGTDFVYYEYFNASAADPRFDTVYLDRVVIEVAPQDANGRPGDYRRVYVWGDSDPTNNDGLSAYCFTEGDVVNGKVAAEEAGLLVRPSCLHGRSGIPIDIGRDDGAVYRFIRIRPFDVEALAQVDAIGAALAGSPPDPLIVAGRLAFWVGALGGLVAVLILLAPLRGRLVSSGDRT